MKLQVSNNNNTSREQSVDETIVEINPFRVHSWCHSIWGRRIKEEKSVEQSEIHYDLPALEELITTHFKQWSKDAIQKDKQRIIQKKSMLGRRNIINKPPIYTRNPNLESSCEPGKIRLQAMEKRYVSRPTSAIMSTSSYPCIKSSSNNLIRRCFSNPFFIQIRVASKAEDLIRTHSALKSWGYGDTLIQESIQNVSS